MYKFPVLLLLFLLPSSLYANKNSSLNVGRTLQGTIKEHVGIRNYARALDQLERETSSAIYWNSWSSQEETGLELLAQVGRPIWKIHLARRLLEKGMIAESLALARFVYEKYSHVEPDNWRLEGEALVKVLAEQCRTRQ